MTQASRKAHSSSGNRNFKAALRSIESAQKAEHQAFDIGRGQIEQMIAVTRDAQRMAMEGTCIHCDNMGALQQVSSTYVQACSEMNNILWAGISGLFSRLLSDAERAHSCQSITDIWELQNLASQQTAETCLGVATDLSRVLFDSYAAAAEPLSQRSADAMKQWQKALSPHPACVLAD